MSLFSQLLLAHYAHHKRPLPWRENPTPYRVWLSEVMLQQTTVHTVIPYYGNFLEHFPTVGSLAEADLDGVLHLWQGLGYYSRARNLHKCAQEVSSNLGGQCPRDVKQLEALSGVGNYTACAVSSMAFGEKAAVVDGNVERVISRMNRIETPLPKSKKHIKTIAEGLLPASQPPHQNFIDYSNAIMDLGATICTPKKPKCATCPVASLCESANAEDAETFPRKEAKKKRPTKSGQVFIITDKNGRIFLQRRPETGLLAKLFETPSKGWDKTDSIPEKFAKNIKKAQKNAPKGHIKHVFTHFTLTLDVYIVQLNTAHTMAEGFYQPSNLPALPTLMRKVLDVHMPT